MQHAMPHSNDSGFHEPMDLGKSLFFYLSRPITSRRQSLTYECFLYLFFVVDSHTIKVEPAVDEYVSQIFIILINIGK